jgi:translation initiation factor IF-1
MVAAPRDLQGRAGCARVRGRIALREGEQRRYMSKGDLLEMEGVIQDALGGGQYTIKVDQGGAMVRAQLSGRMRRHHIRVLPGDRVRVAVSPYDLSHGLIVYRGRS